MQLVITAVGRLKAGPEQDLLARYLKLAVAAGRPVGMQVAQVIEISESKAPSTLRRKADEAERLLTACRGAAVRIALDEYGKAVGSVAFAELLRQHRDAGDKAMAFLIGGPDGHGDAVLGSASIRLSLGPMTLPHGLSRIVLAEQIYRAITILSGHPYHRP